MVAKRCFNDLALYRILTCEKAKPQNIADSYIEELLLNFTDLTLLKSTEADSTRCSQEIMS
jgi:hypothetical protein